MTPKDLIDLRLAGIRDAVSRSRLAFVTITAASLGLLAASWNAYLSWYRYFALGAQQFDDGVTGYAQRQLIRNWVKSQWISLGPLGIETGVSDAAVVGALGLAIISVWFFFCVRREHYDVANLLHEVESGGDALMQRYAYHGVVSQLIFSVVWKHDSPIESLGEIEQLHDKRRQATPDVLVRRALGALFYLAPVAIAMIVTLDILSIVVLPAPFRSAHPPLRSALMGATMWIQAVLMILCAAALGVFTLHIASRVDKFESATVKLLADFALKQNAIADPPIPVPERGLWRSIWETLKRPLSIPG
jgi:hypothetical protein